MRLITPPLPAASRPSKTTTTLASRVDHPVLQLDQLALQTEQLLEIELAIEKTSLAVAVLAVKQALEPAVVHLHFQLFVETVGDFGLNARRGGRAVVFFLLVHHRSITRSRGSRFISAGR